MNKKKTDKKAKPSPNPKWTKISDEMLDQVTGGVHKNRPQLD